MHDRSSFIGIGNSVAEKGAALRFAAIGICTLMLAGCKIGFGTFAFDLKAPKSHATVAEELEAKGRYQDAIDEYQAHVQQRLADTDRPEEENPYFYYLLIGDLYLKLGRFEKAVAAYETAKEQQVDSALTNERLRRLGRYFEERKEYTKAIDAIRPYRDLDPLLFDMEIDRLHRLSVWYEDEQERIKREQAEALSETP